MGASSNTADLTGRGRVGARLRLLRQLSECPGRSVAERKLPAHKIFAHLGRAPQISALSDASCRPNTESLSIHRQCDGRRLANSSFRVRRECRICDRAAEKIERLLERTVILFVRRHVGLRARFFSAFRLEVAAERGLAFHIGARLQIGRDLLQHLNVRLDAFRLD
jgi:hypothetical protein